MPVVDAIDETVVGTVGLGVAGLYQALECVGAGFTVVGYDNSAAVVSRTRQGASPVSDVPVDRLRKALDDERLTVSSDPKALRTCEVFIVAVPTLLDERGRPDVSAVADAADTIADVASGTPLVLVKSTAYPGMTEEVIGSRLNRLGRPGADYFLAYVPERGDPGRRDLDTSRSGSRIVAGATDACRTAATRFYQAMGSTVYQASSLLSAELVKLHENTFRFVNITYVNELADFCRRRDVDPAEVVALAATKEVGFVPFWPGPGVGGLYVPLSPAFLRAAIDDDLELSTVGTALAANVSSPCRAVDALAARMGRPVRDARVVALGLAYKPGSGDVRGSAALSVAREIVAAGANLLAVDQHVDPADLEGTGIDLVPLTTDVLARADIVVLLTRHAVFDAAVLRRWADKLVEIAIQPKPAAPIPREA